MKILLILVALIGYFTSPVRHETVHAFHISKTDMIFQPAEKTVQITMHVFIDDLEKGLEKQGASKLFVGTEREQKDVNALVMNYLQQHFSIQLNDKKTLYTWVIKEFRKNLIFNKNVPYRTNIFYFKINPQCLFILRRFFTDPRINYFFVIELN